MKWRPPFAAVCASLILGWSGAAAAPLNYEEYPSIRLRSLDKITARTLTFDAQVGSTIRFGDIYIKIQSCRKPPPVEKTEAAAFLQIWQVDKPSMDSRWIFSGWMFASSPALSGMDHPVYDVWVIDCLGKDPEAMPPETPEGALPDEGTVPEGENVPVPQTAPEQQKQAPVTPDVPKADDDPIPTDTDVAPEPTVEVEPDNSTDLAPQEPAPKSENLDGIY